MRSSRSAASRIAPGMRQRLVGRAQQRLVAEPRARRSRARSAGSASSSVGEAARRACPRARAAGRSVVARRSARMRLGAARERCATARRRSSVGRLRAASRGRPAARRARPDDARSTRASIVHEPRRAIANRRFARSTRSRDTGARCRPSRAGAGARGTRRRRATPGGRRARCSIEIVDDRQIEHEPVQHQARARRQRDEPRLAGEHDVRRRGRRPRDGVGGRVVAVLERVAERAALELARERHPLGAAIGLAAPGPARSGRAAASAGSRPRPRTPRRPRRADRQRRRDLAGERGDGGANASAVAMVVLLRMAQHLEQPRYQALRDRGSAQLSAVPSRRDLTSST